MALHLYYSNNEILLCIIMQCLKYNVKADFNTELNVKTSCEDMKRN